jgi:hypothetical protein
VQAGVRITGHRPVVRVNDGFKEVHKYICQIRKLG